MKHLDAIRQTSDARRTRPYPNDLLMHPARSALPRAGHPAADCWFGGENEKSLTNGWEMARSSGGCGEAELPHQSVSLECAFSRQLIPIDLLQLLNRCLEALRIDEPIGIECVARFVLLVQSELRCV